MSPDLPAVLVVGPFPPAVGGMATFLRKLCGSSLQRRWRMVPYTISRHAGPPTGKARKPSELLMGGAAHASKSARVSMGHLLGFRKALRASGARVVQITASDYLSFWEGMAYMIMARREGARVCVRFGGTFDQFYASQRPHNQRLIRWCLGQPEAIVVQSEHWKQVFAQVTGADRLHIVPNAVPLPPAPPDRSTRSDPPEALFIVSSNPTRKGAAAVLQAAQALSGHLRFTFVDCRPAFIAQVEAAGLAGSCTCLDTQTPAQMQALYDRADIFLIPSLGEGFPNSMLEAMAAGLPVIGTRVGAIPEVLIQDRGGTLVAPADGPGLTQALAAMAQDSHRRWEQGAFNHARVSREYELDQVMARFGDIWDRLSA